MRTIKTFEKNPYYFLVSVKYTYIIITFLFIASGVINIFDYQLYGYYTEKVIAWVWLFITIVLIIRFWKIKAIRLYFYSLIMIILLSIVPMAIPFLGIVYYFSNKDDFQRIQLLPDLRIELTKHQPLSLPRVYVYEHTLGIFEKNNYRIPYKDITRELNRINNESLSTDIPVIQKATLKYASEKHITINYLIQGKNITITHSKNEAYGY